MWRRPWKTQKKTKAKTIVMSRPGFGTSVVLLLPVCFSNYFTCLVRSCFMMVSSVETDSRVHMYVSI